MTTRLRELLVKATKGPWLICRSYFNNVETGYHITGPEHGSVFPICRKQYETGESNEQAQANAALIVEAVNSLPALLDALEEVEEYLEQRADADCDQDGYIPNEEMKLLHTVKKALGECDCYGCTTMRKRCINEVMK